MNEAQPSANQVSELMVGHLAQATIEMFAEYEFSIQCSASSLLTIGSADGQTLAAVIGYVGDGVRGAFSMIAQEATIHSWLARMGLEGDPVDVLGEFSNMALGRLKTRLIPEGLTLQVSTPTVASGCGLRLSMPPHATKWLAFDGPEWRLWLRLDTSFEPGFTLKKAKGGEAPAEAGDVFLF